MDRGFYTYYDDDLVEYEVEYKFALGRVGTYEDPPEPHDLEIVEVFNCATMKAVHNKDLWDAIDDEIYDELNNQ